jgi:hypothetical protein
MQASKSKYHTKAIIGAGRRRSRQPFVQILVATASIGTYHIFLHRDPQAEGSRNQQARPLFHLTCETPRTALGFPAISITRTIE